MIYETGCLISIFLVVRMVCCHLIYLIVSCPTIVVDSPLWFPLNSINSPIYINLWQIPSSRQLSPSDTRNSAKTPGKLVAAFASDDLRTSHLRNVCHHQDLDISGFPSKLGKLEKSAFSPSPSNEQAPQHLPETICEISVPPSRNTMSQVQLRKAV